MAGKMKNLASEMARFGVGVDDIRSLLNCSDRTVRNKINGMTEFSVSEAIRIRDSFFPGIRIEYLFGRDTQNDGDAIRS